MTRSPYLTTALTLGVGLTLGQAASAATILQYQGGQAGPQTENFADGGDLNAGSDATIDVNYNFGSGFPNAPVLLLDPNSGSSNTTVRHPGYSNFMMADGHVEVLSEKLYADLAGNVGGNTRRQFTIRAD